MSRRCEICQRKPQIGISRSHSNIATKRKLYINLHKKRVNGVAMKLCSSCIKTINKNK